MKSLVAFFSASGVTRAVAGKIAREAGADLFEIEPQVPYSAKDLDWTDRKSRSTLEMTDESSRPEFKKTLNDISGYDTVFIGFPNWWGVEPRIIDTFLESYDFSNKRIAVFFTSGGSGKGKIRERIEKEAGEADVISAERLTSSSDIPSYVRSLGL